MIRKSLFIALAMLPLIVFSQKRTIVISGESYHHRNPVCKVFRYMATPLRFVDKIFHKQRNFTERIYNRITFNADRHRFIYHIPLIINNRERSISGDKEIIILPPVKLLNENRNDIIIKKNGRTIYINRDRRI